MKHDIVCSLIVAAAFAFCGPVHAQSPITLTADTCFTNMQARGVVPVQVALGNAGQSVSGAVSLSVASFAGPSRQYTYHVSLPQGARKVILAYPTVDPSVANGVDVAFSGPGQPRPVTVPIPASGLAAIQVGLIGDDVGGLAGLRSSANAPAQSRATYNDCYCRPEDAPDRGIGYQSLDILVLGEGSERLNDLQWSAIRDWVTGGGNLALMGGAGSLSYLRTPAAADLSPLTNPRDDIVAAPPFSSGPATTIASLTGSPKIGASAGAWLFPKTEFWLWRYGDGSVMLSGVNPLAAPIRGTPQGRELLASLMQTAHYRDDQLQVALLDGSIISYYGGQAYAGGQPYNSGQPYNGGQIIRGQFYSRPSPGDVDDPFRVSLPQTGLVLAMFAAYFLLVIPVTYLVLRRLGRLELAWVTTPVFSAVFVAALCLFTASLYKDRLARRSGGAFCVAAGEVLGSFEGRTEMFFPVGGSYELFIRDAYNLENYNPLAQEMGPSSWINGSQDPLETRTTLDGIVAPRFSAANLAYRRVYYNQSYELSGPITADITSDDKSFRGTITNGSTLAIANARLGNSEIGSIAPGQTVSVSGPSSALAANQGIGRAGDLLAPEPPSLRFQGRIPGASFGPSIGRDVSGNQSVVILSYLPVRLKGESR